MHVWRRGAFPVRTQWWGSQRNEIWGSHGGEDVDVGLLGCNAVWNILPPFSAWKWIQYVSPKRWYMHTSSHGVTSQKPNIDFSNEDCTLCFYVYYAEFNYWSFVAQTATLSMKLKILFSFKSGGDRQPCTQGDSHTCTHKNRVSSFHSLNLRGSVSVETWTAMSIATKHYCSLWVVWRRLQEDHQFVPIKI
jgi:hypothetical protein